MSQFSKGLAGVTAGISAISEVDAEHNRLVYRGYDVHDLVQNCAFDEVAYLLLFGKLPHRAEFDRFMAEVAGQRAVPSAVYDIVAKLNPKTHPMDLLKAAVAALAALDPVADEQDMEANRRLAVSLYAKMPGLVVNCYRIAHGQPPAEPPTDADHTTVFFDLLKGEMPDAATASLFNTTQILYAEHGFNASTFAARVTVSTLSDLASGVVSAIGTLKGPLHGGANEAAMEMLLEIGSADRAAAWVKAALAEKRKIMGFGHREYKNGDERARILKTRVVEYGAANGDTRWAEISDCVEEVMLAEKGLYPNLDFPVASAYYLMGIPIELYTPIFVMARVTGWCAHIIEQLEDNRIIRPHSEYNGPRGLRVAPMDARD